MGKQSYVQIRSPLAARVRCHFKKKKESTHVQEETSSLTFWKKKSHPPDFEKEISVEGVEEILRVAGVGEVLSVYSELHQGIIHWIVWVDKPTLTVESK